MDFTATTPVADDSSTTLQPPSGLVVPNAQPGGKPLFALFTTDWLTLQTFIVQSLQLPIAVGDFQKKYGVFKDEAEIEGVVAAMKAVQALSTTFGDPSTLVGQLAKDPAILQTDTAPTEVYTHIVWFATKLYQAAMTFNQTLGQFIDLLNPKNCGSPAECGAILTQVLTGPGGLQSTAADMLTKCNDLVKALAGFNLQLKPSTDTLAQYTAQGSTFYQDVLTAIQGDKADFAVAQEAADEAYKEWKDYTIAACSTSIGLVILTGGMAWPLAAVAAGVLGDKAAKARQAYNDACTRRDNDAADEKMKEQLQVDLSGFNTQMGPVNDAAQAFLTTLQQVTGVWTGIASDLDFIATNFTPEQLGSLSFIMQSMKLENATSDWKVIAEAANEYTTNSLVSYHIAPFGAPIPAPAG